MVTLFLFCLELYLLTVEARVARSTNTTNFMLEKFSLCQRSIQITNEKKFDCLSVNLVVETAKTSESRIIGCQVVPKNQSKE